jgi:phasin family protein
MEPVTFYGATQKNGLTFIVRCTYSLTAVRLASDQLEAPGMGGVKLKGKTMYATFEDFQKFGKQQFDAVAAAATSLSKGLQEIAAETTEFSKKAIAANTDVVEKLLGAKTFDSAIQIQTEFAKTSYEGLVAETTKIGELYAKLAKEAFRPIETAYSAVSPK